MNNFIEKRWPTLVVISVIAISISMANHLTSSKIPGISMQYKILNQTPIASMGDHSSPRIGLMVEGRTVEKAYLNVIKINNSGTVPLQKDDFDIPIIAKITNDATLIQVRYQFDPADMITELNITPKQLSLTPSLLNTGDEILLQMFTEGEKPDFKIDARIKGVHRIFFDENWDEVKITDYSVFDYFNFLLTVFNLFLFASILQHHFNSRYVTIPFRTAVVVYLSLTAVSLYTYFDLRISASHIIFTSRLMLVGCILLAYLLSWWTIKKYNE